MNSSPAAESSLRRMAAAWNNFFFKPGDPTTLGLMRIMAGVFVLYVHLAYTRDLYSFFGEHAFADRQMANQLRRDFPVAPASGTWIDPSYNLTVPMDRQVRAAFFRWANSLPADVRQRREALNYLIALPLNPQESSESLAFAEHLKIRTRSGEVRSESAGFVPVSDEERARLLDALTRKEIATADRPSIPQHVQGMPVEAREGVRRDVLNFIDTLPKSPADAAMIFNHLSHQAYVPLSVTGPGQPRSELQRTLFYLIGEGEYPMPDDLREREEVNDYLKTWSTDPRRNYARGMYTWSIWFHVTSPAAMAAVHGFILLAMILLALGLWTRITSVIAWLGALCYMHRSVQVLFGMDTMMNICLFYLMIAPSGAALSLDRWLEKRRAARELEKAKRERRDTRELEAILAGPRQSSLATFVTRMLQIHFCFIYAASGCSKLKGPAWWNHTAVWYTLANPEFSPTVFQPYMWALTQVSGIRALCELFMSIGSVFTLALEIGFPFLVWRPLLRPYMIICAILLHTGIALGMGLTGFSLFMLTLLMAFIPPDTVKRWLDLGEQRLRRSPAAPAAEPKPVHV